MVEEMRDRSSHRKRLQGSSGVALCGDSMWGPGRGKDSEHTCTSCFPRQDLKDNRWTSRDDGTVDGSRHPHTHCSSLGMLPWRVRPCTSEN